MCCASCPPPPPQDFLSQSCRECIFSIFGRRFVASLGFCLLRYTAVHPLTLSKAHARVYFFFMFCCLFFLCFCEKEKKAAESAREKELEDAKDEKRRQMESQRLDRSFMVLLQKKKVTKLRVPWIQTLRADYILLVRVCVRECIRLRCEKKNAFNAVLVANGGTKLRAIATPREHVFCRVGGKLEHR